MSAVTFRPPFDAGQDSIKECTIIRTDHDDRSAADNRLKVTRLQQTNVSGLFRLLMGPLGRSAQKADLS
jgi:hypothetical protein